MKITILCLTLVSMAASLAEEIPYGIEFVGGIRTGYHQRGLALADDLIDLQLQTQLTLTKTTSLTTIVWQGAELSGNFRESGGLIGFTKEYEKLSLSAELAYHNIESTLLKSGVELTVGGDYQLRENLTLYGAIGQYTGAKSLIAHLGLNQTKRLSDDSFLTAQSQLHFASDYFGREGLYDVTSRVSFTYNVHSYLSFTPFLSASIPLDGEVETDLSTGVWVELFF